MDIIVNSVKKIHTLLKDSGCEEGIVLLEVDPDVVYCQYDKGACMVAKFGGRSAEFVTHDPVRAQTKISFMVGATLDTLRSRSAACSIINVAAGFFCLSRILHSCPKSLHTDCRNQLHHEVMGKLIFCIGGISSLPTAINDVRVDHPDTADVILINGEGIIAEETGNIIRNYNNSKRIICIGPSTAGIARLNQIEHWCPFGTC
jgi:hypothetical protein